MDILTIIQSVGFPIACVVGLAIYLKTFMNTVMADFKSREGTLLEANKEFAVALSKSADAISDASKDHEKIYGKMVCIEEKVNQLAVKVEGKE